MVLDGGGRGGGMYSQVNPTRIMDETERERGERIREKGDTLRIYRVAAINPEFLK
jgi:hypothetical protein